MAAVTEPRTSWNLSIVVSRVLVSPSCKYILVMASMMIVVVVALVAGKMELRHYFLANTAIVHSIY